MRLCEERTRTKLSTATVLFIMFRYGLLQARSSPYLKSCAPRHQWAHRTAAEFVVYISHNTDSQSYEQEKRLTLSRCSAALCWAVWA